MWYKISRFFFCSLLRFRPVSAIIVQNKTHFLIVQKPRKDNAWQFPQGGQDIGESITDAALRELKEECGDIKVHTPIQFLGTFSYRFPASFKRKDFRGAFVSFFHTDFLSGTITIDTEELCDFKWIESSQFPEFFKNKTYLNAIQQWIQ